MGYNVDYYGGTACILAKDLDEAYRIMCDLNKDDTHKRGGSYEGGVRTACWFPWMDPDYPSKCKDAKEVLEALGFECAYGEEGCLVIDNYDSKSGAEEHFLESIAHLVNGHMDWTGEDGEHWRWLFEDGELRNLSGKVVYG